MKYSKQNRIQKKDWQIKKTYLLTIFFFFLFLNWLYRHKLIDSLRYLFISRYIISRQCLLFFGFVYSKIAVRRANKNDVALRRSLTYKNSLFSKQEVGAVARHVCVCTITYVPGHLIFEAMQRPDLGGQTFKFPRKAKHSVEKLEIYSH